MKEGQRGTHSSYDGICKIGVFILIGVNIFGVMKVRNSSAMLK